MAKKKKAKKKERAAKARIAKGMDAAAASPPSRTSGDADLVQDAYKESLKKMLEQFFTNSITDQNAANEFSDGLKILRDARDKALTLV